LLRRNKTLLKVEQSMINIFSARNEEISAPSRRGFPIGIYLLYENWSTETFRKSQTNGLFVPPTKRGNYGISKDDDYALKVSIASCVSRARLRAPAARKC
jgi:hypothetical protein